MASVGTEGQPKEDEGRASEQAQSAAIAAGSADAGGNDAAAQGQAVDEYDHSDPLQMHPRAAFWVRELLRKGVSLRHQHTANPSTCCKVVVICITFVYVSYLCKSRRGRSTRFSTGMASVRRIS